VIAAIRRRVGREDGFTIVEVLIASFILVLGALAVFMTFAAAVKNVQRGKETQVAQSVAQKEMEKIRSYTYAAVAFPTGSLPTASAETGNFLNRVSGANFNVLKSGTELKPMATSASGKLSAAPTAFSSGGSTGKVYAVAVTMNDKPCEEATKKACTYKRVIVAVQLDRRPNQSYKHSYYELQSNFTDPAPSA
jgi:Tfp pilus assembly protein PilV